MGSAGGAAVNGTSAASHASVTAGVLLGLPTGASDIAVQEQIP